MNIYPAIDILRGKVVRLEKGSYQTSKTYYDCPVEVAKSFFQDKAKFLHMVDLDGAKKEKIYTFQNYRSDLRKYRSKDPNRWWD